MKRFASLIIFFVIYFNSNAQVVFSEVMFYSNSNFPEFIEIYNTSDKDTIDVNKYLFLYYTAKPDTILSAGFGTKLKPKQYGIIFPAGIDISQNPYLPYIKGEPLILKINDNNFGSSGMANTTDRKIKLIKGNDTIDSYTYTANNKQGYSDEKIDVENKNSLWGNSTKLNGTPGYKNSLAPLDFDIEIKKITINKKNIKYYDTLSFSILLKNNGVKSYPFELNASLDFDSDGIVDSLLYKSIINILPKDSVIFNIPNYYVFTKECAVLFSCSSIFDEILENNTKSLTIAPSIQINDIVINEVMFYPSNGEPEWIELYNNSNYSINLKNFSISDNSKSVAKINSDLIISPKKYLVITKSTDITNFHSKSFEYYVLANLPSLNNDYDAVVLKDTYGNVIDSLFYNSAFKPKAGFSIERIEVNKPTNLLSNWGVSTSIEQSTPGFINSLSPKNIDIAIKDVILKTNSQDKNYFDVKIFNNGLVDVFLNEIIIQKYNNTNFVDIGKIQVNQVISLQQEIIFASDVINDISGIYKIFFLLNDEDETNNSLTKEFYESNKYNDILISEIMFSPDSDEPEWIELYNACNQDINLKNWLISDVINPTKQYITKNDYILKQDNFVVVAYDTVKFKLKYPSIKSNILQAKFGALSDDDGVVVYDANNTFIDSVYYKTFLKKSRKSIEKIKLKSNSNDKNNWGICLKKSTPATFSSYHKLNEYGFENVVFSEIMYDPLPNNSEFVEFYNKTNYNINLAGWKLKFDDNLFLISDTTKFINSNKYFIFAANDSLLKFYNLNQDTIANLSIYNSSEFGLTLTGKTLYLLDAFNNIIDSMSYSNSMHKFIKTTKNISLEKINFNLPSSFYTNWGSSLSSLKATPFGKNSIQIDAVQKENSNITIFPNPFSPDGDGFEDFTTITMKLKNNINKVRIKVFDVKGRLVKNLINDELVPSNYSVIYDGTDDNNRKLPIGVYILYVESKNTDDFKSEVYKKVFVVAKK